MGNYKRKLEQLSTKGKYLFLAYDHGLEHGPADFNERSADPNFILDIVLQEKYSAVVLQGGIAEKYWKDSPYESKVPLILKLNGRTNLWKGEPFSPQLYSVESAKNLGAQAVGYTVHLGSEFEYKMMREFGRIVEEAHRLRLPVIGWMYPRGKSVENDTAPEVVAYAARVGLEMGADMVKIKYPGSAGDFAAAVRAAGKVKVVLSGGSKLPTQDFLRITENVMRAGAAGVAVGRNVWQNENPLAITGEIKKIIFNGT